MSLDPDPMQKAILKLLKKEKPKSAAIAAKKLAKIYTDYAKGAVAGAYGPVSLTGSETPRLEALLRSALSLPMGAPPIIAAAWATGLTLFWAGAVFTGGGAATVVIGAPIALGGLSALYMNMFNTEEVCAAGMATILDIVTRTVLVIGPLGPQPVV